MPLLLPVGRRGMSVSAFDWQGPSERMRGKTNRHEQSVVGSDIGPK